MHRVMRWGRVMVWVLLIGMPPVSAGVKTDSLVRVFVNMNSMD